MKHYFCYISVFMVISIIFAFLFKSGSVIGEIIPYSSKQHGYILIAVNYFTWWVKAILPRQVNYQQVIHFLNHNIIARFGVPNSLVFDNATYFSSFRLYDFALENCSVLKHSSNYYPQGNGLVESTNKNLIWIIKKIVLSQQINWHNALINSLWVDSVTQKPSRGTSPYFLIYGKEAILPPIHYLPALQLSQESWDRPWWHCCHSWQRSSSMEKEQ